MVRRIVCNAFGTIQHLQVVEEPDPLPQEGQVIVQVEAAGANFVDSLMVIGSYQIKPQLPFTPGMEVAGRVVGSDQRVMATTWFGGYATKVAVARESCIEIPQGVSATQAATLAQSYATGRYALEQRGALREGEWVVVLGAGGGVGLAAVDIARSLGARVLACASSEEKLAAARAMGAEATVAYEETGLDLKNRIREITGGGADLVYDPVGGARSEQVLRSLAWGGRLLIIGFASGDIPRLPTNQMLLNNRSVIGVDWGAWSSRNPESNRGLIAGILSDVAAGRLHPVEPVTYPLDQACRCLEDLVSRRVVGKAVLIP